MDTERDKKRKESEPCSDVGDSLEEDNAETHPDIDPPDTTQWMEDTLKRLKERTDDVGGLALTLEAASSCLHWREKRGEKRGKREAHCLRSVGFERGFCGLLSSLVSVTPLFLRRNVNR